MGLLAVVCISSTGESQEARTRPPPFRCLFEGRTAGIKRLDGSGDKWLDTRIRSERSFLKSLFRTEAEVVLFADDAPRDAFVTQRPTGEVLIGIKASWLVDYCTKKKDHTTARVAYTLAHLYAHALQARMGCELTELARERHADMLAGWYLGRRNIATLKGKPPMNASFAPLVFTDAVEYRNELYEHGTPDMRAKALAEGFKLWRGDRLSLRKVYPRGLNLFPAASVGLVGAESNVPGPLRAAMNQLRLKVGCRHQGPCKHKIACTHPKPCRHKVECRHLDPCDHRTPCVHRVDCTHCIPCVHKQRCTHRIACTHRVECTHKARCTHTLHDCDYKHEYDLNTVGERLPCRHPIRCTHFKHDFHWAHNFDLAHECDYEHDFDFAHKFDTKHDFDFAHEFDTQHEGHPRHDFDMAHEWDPVHDHDLAHKSDPVHDYDIELKPKVD